MSRLNWTIFSSCWNSCHSQAFPPSSFWSLAVSTAGGIFNSLKLRSLASLAKSKATKQILSVNSQENRLYPSFQAFPQSSFWSLAVRRNGGGRPGPFYHVNDVSYYLGSGGAEGSLIERMHFTHVLNQEWYVFCLNVQNSSAWDKNYKKRPQAHSFNWDPSPAFRLHRRHSLFARGYETSLL